MAPKKKRGFKGVSLNRVIVKDFEGANPFRAQHDGGIVTECIAAAANTRVMIRRQRASAECWLDRYLRRGKICAGEHDAGLKFRSAWLVSIYGVAAASLRERVDGGNPAGSAEDRLNQLHYADRVVRAALKVLSPEQKLAVINICGNDQAAGDTYAIDTLRRGLDRMARLWNFV